MKKIIITPLVFFAITICLNHAFSLTYPSPKGYVNDFADIIPHDIESRIEVRLLEYEKQTSIEIAVVTTKSLDGLNIEEWTIGIATEWGVGKKGKDNGLVFAIAPNERKARIEVGYGLEGDMNDAKAGRILDENAIPSFKQGNYAEGIEKATDVIMNALGRISLQQRNEARLQRLREEQERAEKEAEERKIAEERAKERFHSFMIIILIIAVCSGIFFLILLMARAIASAIREHKRKNMLRKSIRNALSKMRDERIPSLKKRLEDARKKSGTFPSWARRLAELRLKAADSAIRETEIKYIFIEEENEKNPDGAEMIVDATIYCIENASADISAVAVDMPKEIESYIKSADKGIQEAEKLFADARISLVKVREEGLFEEKDILTFSKKLDESEASLNAYKNKISKENAPETCNSVNEINKAISAATDKIKEIMLTKRETDEQLKVLPNAAGEIEKAIPVHEEILNGIKKAYPKENWDDMGGSLLVAAGLVATARQLISVAKEHNSVEQKRFYNAKQEILKAHENLDKAMSMLESIKERKHKIEEAKQSHVAELSKAELNVKGALEKIKDSDVGVAAKNMARQAETKLKEVKKIIESSGMINWLSVIAMLATIMLLASEAKRKAQDDIDDAEEERRRKRREEEDRKSRAAAYHSSPSSYSFSSSSRSSFGGFGGGNFGGGGASRGW